MTTSLTQHEGLEGITNHKSYANGQLKSCILNKENRIPTSVGEIIPQYKPAEFGERQKKYRNALTFHENGQIKSAALDSETPLKTPIGTYKAELVTFHENGSINRLFPLNGQIDGYWTEKNERDRAEKLPFRLPIGEFEAKVISMRFYTSGALRSLTFWPGEKVKLDTTLGTIRVGTGLSLYEDGNIQSLEPARPTKIETPIGDILAFDTEIIGMHADLNSVQFTEDGDIRSIKTVNTGIQYSNTDGKTGRIEPVEAPSLIDINDTRTIPLQVEFLEKEIRCHTPETIIFDRAAYTLATYKRDVRISSGCASCTGCSSAPEERCPNAPESDCSAEETACGV